MKNTIIIGAILVLAAAAGGYAWWQGSGGPAEVGDEQSATTTASGQAAESQAPAESAATLEPGTYEADTEASSVTWQAGKPAIAGYVHTGAFALLRGTVAVTDNDLSGEFVIDMDSLRITSLGGGKAGQESALERHLRTESFFDVEQYPTATFRITDIEPKVLPGPAQADYTAKGELTMKGQTHEVSFPIRIVVDAAGAAWAEADLEIDRTEWGINFGSAKFVDQITDQVIGDTVRIALRVTLEK